MTTKQLQRLWREFPWLWGICRDWNYSNQVRVRDADEVNIWDLPYVYDRNSQRQLYDIWVYCTLAMTTEASRLIKLGELVTVSANPSDKAIASQVVFAAQNWETQNVAIVLETRIELFRVRREHCLVPNVLIQTELRKVKMSGVAELRWELKKRKK
jgi:hypothetical protein